MILLGWVGTPEVLLLLGLLLVMPISAWLIFVKANKPGWAAIIPIYNTIVLLQIIRKPWWWLLLLFVPIANLVFAIWMINLLSKSFGKSELFTIGLFLLPIVFYPIMAFGGAEYIYKVVKPNHSTGIIRESINNKNSTNDEGVLFEATQTGIDVKLKFFPLAFFLFAVTPTVEINGAKEQKKWGSHFIKLSPGEHIIKIYFSYMGKNECGANQVHISLRVNEIKNITFYMPPWMFAKGKIRVV